MGDQAMSYVERMEADAEARWVAAEERHKFQEEVAPRLIAEYLKSKGVQMTVWGCNCCGSPYVKLTLDDGSVIEDKNISFAMHEKWGEKLSD